MPEPIGSETQLEDDAANEPIFDSSEIKKGDVIAYIGEGAQRMREPPADASRHWLTVSRVDEQGVHGHRVNPQDWERDLEFVVVPTQLENNGVFRRAD